MTCDFVILLVPFWHGSQSSQKSYYIVEFHTKIWLLISSGVMAYIEYHLPRQPCSHKTDRRTGTFLLDPRRTRLFIIIYFFIIIYLYICRFSSHGINVTSTYTYARHAIYRSSATVLSPKVSRLSSGHHARIGFCTCPSLDARTGDLYSTNRAHRLPSIFSRKTHDYNIREPFQFLIRGCKTFDETGIPSHRQMVP